MSLAGAGCLLQFIAAVIFIVFLMLDLEVGGEEGTVMWIIAGLGFLLQYLHEKSEKENKVKLKKPISSYRNDGSNTDLNLFLDIETTGMPLDVKASYKKVSNWPFLVQVAWLLTDGKGVIYEENDFIIRPDGYSIPESSTKIHGITTSKALREGEYEVTVLKELKKRIDKADKIIAHNIEFDLKILKAAFYRNDIKNNFRGSKKICLMKASTAYCRIPGKYGNYKWPTLNELHFKLFNKNIQGAHNAKVDVEAAKRCYFQLKSLCVI